MLGAVPLWGAWEEQSSRPAGASGAAPPDIQRQGLNTPTTTHQQVKAPPCAQRHTERIRMSQHNSIDIMIPVCQNNGAYRSPEVLSVEQISDNHVRLLHSPGFVYGLAAGDEIELQPGTTTGYRVSKHAGNLCVWFFYEQKGKNKVQQRSSFVRIYR